jgi:hypothetical protein
VFPLLFRAVQSAFLPARRAALSLAAAALLLSAPSAFASSSVPDWVRDAAHQTLPEYPARTPAVVLLWETTYTVGPDGRAIEHVRKVIKVLRPQGREDARPVVYYDRDSKITSFHVWSIDPAGHEFTAKDSDIGDFSAAAGFEAYTDARARVANPPGLDPGGIIALEYEKKMRPYLAETTWSFQGDIPHLKQSFTIALPAGFLYNATFAHHPRVDGSDLENHSYRWEMNSEPAIDLDSIPLAPPEGSLEARMTVHYSGPGLAEPQEGTWQGIGVWFDGLAHDRMAASPEIAAKAAELTAGKTDFFDKAQAIGEYVQGNIRYVAVEIGIGGEQPHAAADIFHNKYGDCKDKATLLSALLSSVGIHSTLVIVDTERGVIDPDDPSTYGNHAIGAIEIPTGYDSPRLKSVVKADNGKRYLIFDPTWELTPFGQLENNLQGSYGILMEGKESQIIQFPVMPPELNSVSRSASFKLSPEGTLTGAVTEKSFGDVAEFPRRLARQADGKEQQTYMDRIAARDFSSVLLTGLKFTDANTLSKDVVTTFNLEAANYAVSTGPLLMIRPRVFGTYQLPVDHKNRKLPIDLRETTEGHDDFDIVIPDGYVVDEMPEPVKHDWGFASYESKTELHGNTLHYTRSFAIREITLPPRRYKDLQDMVATIGNDEDNRVILKRAAKPIVDTPSSASPAFSPAAH